jgi:putative endopeptidase
MSDFTKKNALYKLNKMIIKIGYNDKIKTDYSYLNINNNNTYFENILKILKFNNEIKLNKLYQPIDKNRWLMYGFSVNAYYESSFNEIVIPAGILQEPFFYENNIIKTFGAIGSIIGHEIIHGFDDQGCKYDGNGNLNNWWTDKDVENYNNAIKILEKQYNNYIIENEKVNGLLTLGENIADIGGCKLSFLALINFLNSNNIKYNKKNLEKFFESFAIMWREKTRVEKIKYNLINDTHSPKIFRVNGTLHNIDYFYNIYNIKNNNENKFNVW